jgi:nitrogen regulatory protein PII-like uncharacterized protein
MDESVLKNVVKMNNIVFAAYVIQAIRIMAELMEVHPRDVMISMSTPSTTASAVTDAIYNVVGTESIDPLEDLLREDGEWPPYIVQNAKAGMERIGDNIGSRRANDTEVYDVNKLAEATMGMYDVSITYRRPGSVEPQVIVIPVIIIPVIIFTDVKELIDSLVLEDKDASFRERLDQYRAGVISLKDLIFATDLVKKYKEKKLKNKNDVAKLIKEINSVNNITGLISGRMKFSTNFNMYIFDINEKPLIDDAIGGDVYKFKYRRALADKLRAFSFTFVDNDKERIVYMLDDIMSPSVLTFKMLKNQKDAEINDVFKNLLLNKPPF